MSAPTETALDHLRRAVEALKAERLALVNVLDEGWSADDDERLIDMTRWLKSMESVEAHMEGWAYHDRRKGVAA